MSDLLDLATITVSAFFIVLALVLMMRYREASKRISESATLNQDLWRATEDRLKKQDERILDVIGRLEVVQAHHVSERPQRSVMQRDMQPPPEQVTYLQPQRAPRAVVRALDEADDTEKAIIKLLEAGPMSSVDVRKSIRKSREHTARMMKALFDKGLVARDDSAKPFVYQLTERGRDYLDTIRR